MHINVSITQFIGEILLPLDSGERLVTRCVYCCHQSVSTCPLDFTQTFVSITEHYIIMKRAEDITDYLSIPGAKDGTHRTLYILHKTVTGSLTENALYK